MTFGTEPLPKQTESIFDKLKRLAKAKEAKPIDEGESTSVIERRGKSKIKASATKGDSAELIVTREKQAGQYSANLPMPKGKIGSSEED